MLPHGFMSRPGNGVQNIPKIHKFSGSLDIRIHFSTIKLLVLIMVMSSYGKVEQEDIQLCPQRKEKSLLLFSKECEDPLMALLSLILVYVLLIADWKQFRLANESIK